MSELTETAIVEAVRSGGREGQTAMVGRYAERVFAMIARQVPDDERMLLTLYYFEDRPLTEITYITGIEAKPLANRLYRTRKKIFQKLKMKDEK